MKKIFLVCMLLLASLFQASPQFAQAQDVKSFVRNFYSWYIKQSLPLHGNPVFDDAIFKYVCKDTARRVRLDYERSVADTDYYLKGQDVDEKLLENLIVDKSITVNNSLSLVSVSRSFRKEYVPSVVVYVETRKDGMCISKVERIEGRNRRGEAY